MWQRFVRLGPKAPCDLDLYRNQTAEWQLSRQPKATQQYLTIKQNQTFHADNRVQTPTRDFRIVPDILGRSVASSRAASPDPRMDCDQTLISQFVQKSTVGVDPIESDFSPFDLKSSSPTKGFQQIGTRIAFIEQ